jgi:hypothetical protein
VSDSFLCLYCGDVEYVELFEIWEPGHEFMLDTCCEGKREEVSADMADSPEYGAALMRELGVEELMGHEIRRVADNDGQLILDYDLEIHPIARDDARAFVNEHHAHNKAPVSWRYGAGIWNGDALLGVVMCGRPVARMLDANAIVEVNRVCVRRDMPAPLRWNACSMLYGWAAREAKKRGFAKIITYTLVSESAVSLKAVGWKPAARTKGGSWNRPGRARVDSAPTVPKIRWERELKAAA